MSSKLSILLFKIITGILNDEFRDCMRSPNVCPSKLGSRLARRYTKNSNHEYMTRVFYSYNAGDRT